MAKQTPTGPSPDNGTWFLEVVSAKSPSPTPSEAIAELTRENTVPDLPAHDTEASPPSEPDNVEILLVSFDGDPGTSLSSFDPIPALPSPPPDLLGSTIETDLLNSAPIMDDFDDSVLPPALRTKRRFRWPVIVFLVFVTAAVGIAVVWLPRAVAQEALAVRQSYYDATLAVRTYLPPSQTALDAITNPGSTDSDVGESVPVITRLSSHATNLETVAAAPLPTKLPLVPSGPIDALVPLRDRSAILASDSSEIARRLGHGYVYRTSIPQLLNTGELPTSGTTAVVNELSLRLASSLADDAALIADLPTDSSFASVLDQATKALDRYGPWQDEYFAALTGEDPDSAAVLVSELDTIRTELVAQNERALLEFRTEMDARIMSLAGELEAHLDDLSR
ncbi:MAG: hypothetical protein BMS9Abin20_1511 [Acidimicrobiia bacterium]|nr:MAG: hypothetical protein BMS9Abin20_1511 [Acidimicrobiia bacterium]